MSGHLSLRGECTGAVMVMCLPFTFFLIGILHYAWGIGEAIILRETMQDAADASAYSAAVMMARGMNLIVLINVVMASLLAILVMLRLTEVMLLVGIGLCSLLAWPTGGATLAAIPELKAAQTTVNNTYNTARAIVNPTLGALHTTATVLRYAMPLAAQARVIDTSRQYAPPAVVGFAIPNQFALPTEDGTEAQLCGKAGEYAANIATLPVRWLLPGPVLDVLEDGLGDATQALASYFCASRPGAPPPISVPERRVQQQFPKLPKTRECEDMADAGRQTVDPAHQRVCAEAREEVQRSEPDRLRGTCMHADCSAYQTRIELARTECMPDSRARLQQWMWQERDVTLWARLHDTHPYPIVERQEPIYSEPRYVRADRPPCGADEAIDAGWSHDMTQPLCVEAHEELAADGPLTNRDAPLEVSYREVMQVLGCSKAVALVSPTATAGPAPAPLLHAITHCGPTRRVHQNVLANATLGDETFQLRAVVIGEGASAQQQRILEAVVPREPGAVPSRDVGLSATLQRSLQGMSQVFVAQAEYYFDADLATGRGADRLEWMWTMDWRARLVRFRLPHDDASSSAPRATDANTRNARCGVTSPPVDLMAACELARGGDRCADAQRALGDLSALVIH